MKALADYDPLKGTEVRDLFVRRLANLSAETLAAVVTSSRTRGSMQPGKSIT